MKVEIGDDASKSSRAAEQFELRDEKAREAFQEILSEGVAELKTWLKMAGIERSSPRPDIAALSQATASRTSG